MKRIKKSISNGEKQSRAVGGAYCAARMRRHRGVMSSAPRINNNATSYGACALLAAPAALVANAISGASIIIARASVA
jgi:hypothetical protein